MSNSGFRDQFSKNNEAEDLLKYDDTAFLFFVFSVLVVIVVPWTYRTMKNIFFPERKYEAMNFPKTDKQGNKFRYCKCSQEVMKSDGVRAELRANRLNKGTLGRIGVLCILWVILYFDFQALRKVENIRTFDPFQILEVPRDANDKDIKKAYRRLSMIYHPDKNPDNPDAQAEFIRITKAYSALTDEHAKKMYEKYGNPDGAATMKVGIGLPRFLLREEMQVPVLIMFAVLLFFFVPMLFIMRYLYTKDYAASGVMLDTLQFLCYNITQKSVVKDCIEWVAVCTEAASIPCYSGDLEALQSFAREIRIYKEAQYKFPFSRRNIVLFSAYWQRIFDKLTPSQKQEAKQLLMIAEKITPSMIEIASMREWLNVAKQMCEFRRRVLQAIDLSYRDLMQLPGVDQEIAEKIVATGKVDDCRSFLKLSHEERMSVYDWTPDQKADLMEFCNHVPDMEVDAKIYVDGEDVIVEGDIMTISITLTRKNLKEGEAAGPIYAPYFPEPVYEEWWVYIMMNGGNKLCSMEKLRSTDRVQTVDVQMQVSMDPGKNTLLVYAMCDSYFGVDRVQNFEFNVVSDEDVKREIFIHPDDRDLDLLPTLYEQCMGLNPGEGEPDSSDDENAKPAPAAKKKVEESSSDSSSDSSDSDDE